MKAGRTTNLTPAKNPWEALEALRSKYAVDREMPPGGFTVAEYLARYPHLGTLKVAKGELDRMVEIGELHCKKIPYKGRITNVFWIPEVTSCHTLKPSTTGPSGRKTARQNG